MVDDLSFLQWVEYFRVIGDIDTHHVEVHHAAVEKPVELGALKLFRSRPCHV